MNDLKKITIVGGGTAGYIAALILKLRYPTVDIEIIKSDKIGIIGVGEGTTEHWNEFLKYINVPWQMLFKHCDATFKCGIKFKGWGVSDYMHSIGPEHELKNGQYLLAYGLLISSNASNKELNPILVWDNLVSADRLNPSSDSPYNQYHFNTHKLNDFLKKISIQRKIKIIDDKILDLTLNENGEIDLLIGEKNNYTADFFIDCTGFRKILISKLGAKWKSHSEFLKMKSAIVFPTNENKEYNLWTTAQAMDYGWMFSIPVWGRNGNGYIFDSDYLTPSKAKEEVEKFLGHDIDVSKQLQFDPGFLDRVWIKNCCAIGLSANFIEPLEATSIGTSIQQTFLLMHRLPNYTQKTIDNYNKNITDIMLNIRDFVCLHYIVKKKNSQFWEDIANLAIPDTLAEKLEQWKHNLPIADDFNDQTAYLLFKEPHFIQILAGLKLFNLQKIQNEYNLISPHNKARAEDFIRETQTFARINPTVSHKKFIELIRNS